MRPDGTPQLIDNDHELGGRSGYDQALLQQPGPACSPSSLFLPFNLESWRVRALHAAVQLPCMLLAT